MGVNMAMRDFRLPQASLALTVALLGCGRSPLTAHPGDAGLDGLSGMAGVQAGISGARTSSGGTPAGGASVTGGLGSVVGGRNTGGVSKTGGRFSSSLTGSAGRGGSLSAGTIATGGALVTGGSVGRGGNGGRVATGGSSIVASAGRTSKGGSSGGGGAAGTGSRGGSGGTGGVGQTTGGTGGSTGGAGGSGGGTAAALFQPLVEAFCNTARRCCARASYRAADLADCRSEFLNRLEGYSLLSKGTVLVNEPALAACTSAYEAAATGCTINAIRAACRRVFVGLRTEGQACGGTSKFGAVECKPVDGTATCYRPQGDTEPTSAGTCVSVPRGKNGDACSMTCQKGETCIVDMLGEGAPFPATCFEEDGLFCSMASNPTVCKPLLHIGDTCKWEGNPCGSGNYCNWMDNTCAPAGKLGESCRDRTCSEDLMCGEGQTCVELPLASDSLCKGFPPTP